MIKRALFLGIVLIPAPFTARAADGKRLRPQYFECSAPLTEPSVSWFAPQLGDAGPKLQDLFRTRSAHPLWPDWIAAMAKIDAMKNAVLDIPENERAYFTRILDASWAALGRHQLEFAKEDHLKELQVPRHRAILRTIGEFDQTQARFSMYKIKRVIEERYSLSEYSRCY